MSLFGVHALASFLECQVQVGDLTEGHAPTVGAQKHVLLLLIGHLAHSVPLGLQLLHLRAVTQGAVEDKLDGLAGATHLLGQPLKVATLHLKLIAHFIPDSVVREPLEARDAAGDVDEEVAPSPDG